MKKLTRLSQLSMSLVLMTITSCTALDTLLLSEEERLEQQIEVADDCTKIF